MIHFTIIIEFTGVHAEQAIAPSASPAPEYSKVLQNELGESEKTPISVPSLSKLVLLPKELSVPQPNPGSQLTSVQQYAMAVDVVANTTRKTINFRRVCIKPFQFTVYVGCEDKFLQNSISINYSTICTANETLQMTVYSRPN